MTRVLGSRARLALCAAALMAAAAATGITLAAAGSLRTSTESTGWIEGQVFDGASSSPDATLAGACATAVDAEGGSHQSAQTSGSGDYTISALPDGAYEVFVWYCASPASSHDYAPEVYAGHVGLDSDMTDPVNVRAGVATKGIDVRLPEGGAVQAHVVTSTGAPVSDGGVCPEFSSIDAQDGFCQGLDSGGNATLIGVPAGEDRFSAFDSDTGQSAFYRYANAGTTVFWLSDKVIVRPGRTETITITIPAAAASPSSASPSWWLLQGRAVER